MASGDVVKWAMGALGAAYEYKSEQKTLADIQEIADSMAAKTGGRSGWDNYIRGCGRAGKDPLDPLGGPSIKDGIDTANENFLNEKLEEIKSVEAAPVIVEVDLDYEQETQDAIEKAMEEREREIEESKIGIEEEVVPAITAEEEKELTELPIRISNLESQIETRENQIARFERELERARDAGLGKKVVDLEDRIATLEDLAEPLRTELEENRGRLEELR